MLPWVEVATTKLPNGTSLSLKKRGDEFAILFGNQLLMGSRIHASEDALATLGCDYAKTLPTPRVLIGGLGMGYTLRATLDELPKGAKVVVAELMQEVVDWNRGPIAHLAKHPLDDRRVKVALGDVQQLIATTAKGDVAAHGFDAILLDTDNSPSAFTQSANGWMYRDEGLAVVFKALRPGGVMAVWSADPDRAFEKRLVKAGFTFETKTVKGHSGRHSPTHYVFLGKVPLPKAIVRRWTK